MMLGKDLIFYGNADIVHLMGRDVQRLWLIEKDKDRTTTPFYDAQFPVYSWLLGSVTSNMYQFDEHSMWIGTTSGWDKQVYLLLSPVGMPLCARGLVHCCLLYSSLFIAFAVAQLCEVFCWPFQRDAQQEPLWFHASDQVLWYVDKYLSDCGHADAVVVVADTPAMAARIAMSCESGRPKVAFLAVSAIKQKDIANAIGGALQHAIIMRYMLEADQTEQGVTAATCDTQEEWLLCGIPLLVLEGNRGHEGHQKVHAAEAVQQHILTEASADHSEPTAPAPTLPKLKKTAQVVPTWDTAAGRGTPSSSKKQAKVKGKDSDKPGESDNNDADEEIEEEDLAQVLETR